VDQRERAAGVVDAASHAGLAGSRRAILANDGSLTSRPAGTTRAGLGLILSDRPLNKLETAGSEISPATLGLGCIAAVAACAAVAVGAGDAGRAGTAAREALARGAAGTESAVAAVVGGRGILRNR
jgi:hypothetical protein